MIKGEASKDEQPEQAERVSKTAAICKEFTEKIEMAEAKYEIVPIMKRTRSNSLDDTDLECYKHIFDVDD